MRTAIAISLGTIVMLALIQLDRTEERELRDGASMSAATNATRGDR